MNKFNKFKSDIHSNFPHAINLNLSPASSFRNRCEFGYSNNAFVMHDGKTKLYITYFINAASSIQKIMPLILNRINLSDSVSFSLLLFVWIISSQIFL